MALTNEAVAGNVTDNKTIATTIPKNILDGYNVEIATPAPFTGGTAGTRGAFATAPTTTLFTVQGEVKVIVYGVVPTALVGAATIAVGLTGNTALILPSVADTSTAVSNSVYVDATPTEVRGFAASALPVATYITNSNNIIETVGTANITSGVIYYVCLWIPISPNGLVKAVNPSRVN